VAVIVSRGPQGGLSFYERPQVAAEPSIGPTLLGEYVAEKLMMGLSATGRVELVERNRLDTVCQEQKLGVSGLIDDATASSIGNIAGAQAAQDHLDRTPHPPKSSGQKVLANFQPSVADAMS